MEAPATTLMWPPRSDSNARDAGADSERGVVAVARAKLGMRLTSHHDAALAPVPTLADARGGLGWLQPPLGLKFFLTYFLF